MKKKTASENPPRKAKLDPKQEQLAESTEVGEGTTLTSNQGLAINDDQNSLKAGPRGPSLLEDFLLREKITHFDHERIPERVVHARGNGAHGFFQVYKPLGNLTKAGFLQDPSVKTPVFVRFSTVAGSRGSSDLARDVRGFSVRFYTQEGNFDLVGNNIPVFFIQDAIKFPDLIHAVKPEPHNEMPQAASAHDTFWDFISLMPESMHMILWVMSDRALPRSLRMMEGFGVHTFRLINVQGKSRFVKFHWKPLLGVHSVVWDEAQKISGKDPDFHRRDLWEAIESGEFPEWELGFQCVDEEDEHKFDFDLLDPTKLIPEELVPVQRVGKLTLNRNPDNFFAEVEQVAFHPGHVVPGIDFSNDSLLQGRLFSYTDTQLIRLGGPNFAEIPINRPLHTVHNNQRDGHMRQMINRGRVSYSPNTLGGDTPAQAMEKEGGFVSFFEKMTGQKVRARGEKFFDHFSQALLFWQSQSDPEKDHIVKAFRFELGKLETVAIRERMVALLALVDKTLASRVAEGLGLEVGKVQEPINRSIPADGKTADYQPKKVKLSLAQSRALSMAHTPKDSIATRQVAVLMADGFDEASFTLFKKALTAQGAVVKVVAPRLGNLKNSSGGSCLVDVGLFTTASVLFDAVMVAGGEKSAKALADEPDAVHFVNEAFKHCKTVGALGAGSRMLETSHIDLKQPDPGLVLGGEMPPAKVAERFIVAMKQHRHWVREKADSIPA